MNTKILVKKANSNIWTNTLTIIDSCTNATLTDSQTTTGKEVFDELQKILEKMDLYTLEQKVRMNDCNTQIGNLIFKYEVTTN